MNQTTNKPNGRTNKERSKEAKTSASSVTINQNGDEQNRIVNLNDVWEENTSKQQQNYYDDDDVRCQIINI